MSDYKYNKELWDEIVTKGEEKDSRGENDDLNNLLSADDVQTIIATMEFFGATETCMLHTRYDLTIPKFRVFDWLAMNVMGRNDDSREVNNTALRVLIHAFRRAGYDPELFIERLLADDYEIELGWEEIKIDL